MALKGIYIDGVKCLFAPEDILDGGIEPYTEALTEYCNAWLEENYSDNTVLRSDQDINVNNIVAGGNVTILGNISAANFDPDTFTSYQPGDNIIFTEGEGTTTISAVDPPEYIAGNNVTFTEGTKQNTITIDAVDTVYDSMSEAEATAGSSVAARTISPAVLNGAIKERFVVETKTGQVTVSKNSTGRANATITKSGYTPLGVVGFVSSSASCNVYGVTLVDSSTARALVLHAGTVEQDITVTVSFHILYIKN